MSTACRPSSMRSLTVLLVPQSALWCRIVLITRIIKHASLSSTGWPASRTRSEVDNAAALLCSRQVKGQVMARLVSVNVGLPRDIACADRYRVNVRRGALGAAGNYIDEKLQVGDVIEVSAARGNFVLRPGDAPVVLLSAGIGATPHGEERDSGGRTMAVVNGEDPHGGRLDDIGRLTHPHQKNHRSSLSFRREETGLRLKDEGTGVNKFGIGQEKFSLQVLTPELTVLPPCRPRRHPSSRT